MFGGLKKKLQEAISKVAAPKKSEIEQEIGKQEAEALKQEIRAEVEELAEQEKETKELIETGKEEPGEEIARLEEDIEAGKEKEEIMLKELEKELWKEKKEDVERIAREEFEKISAAKMEKTEEEKEVLASVLAAETQLEEETKKEAAEKEEEMTARLIAAEAALQQEEAPAEQATQEKEELPAAETKLSEEELKKQEKRGIFGIFKRKEKKPSAAETMLERIEEELPTAEAKAEPEEKRSFISGIVKKIAEKTLTEADIDSLVNSLQLALLENDVALEVAEKICSGVRSDLLGKSVKRGEVERVVKASLKSAMLNIMRQETIDIDDMLKQRTEPLTLMFLGFNGTGKTTTLCKFASKFRKYSPVIAAGDTFRAASIEQLEEHGSRLGLRIIRHDYGSDSAAVIFDAKKHAAASGSKLVLADTAGRSHSNVNLMDELKKVVRVNKPDLKLLVLDSVTGNDIYEQARLFNDAVGVDGIILTKADVYDKGGAALSAAYTIKKPILYLGIGQEYADLKEFVPEEVVENLLGQ